MAVRMGGSLARDLRATGHVGSFKVYETLSFSGVAADDGGVGSREEEFLVVAILPLDHVRGSSLFSVNFDNDAMSIGLACPMPSDQDVIANTCQHCASHR